MGTTVKSMSSAMKGMQVDKIAKTMSEFERQFENMDVTSGVISREFSNIERLQTNFPTNYQLLKHDMRLPFTTLSFSLL